jgi:DNA-binding MarR family transcriptional regulator
MSRSSSRSPGEQGTELLDLPPSAKLVAKTLEYEGDATQAQLAESTLLPVRTVRDAVSRLEENGVVSSRISFQDARQRVYSLDGGRAEH